MNVVWSWNVYRGSDRLTGWYFEKCVGRVRKMMITLDFSTNLKVFTDASMEKAYFVTLQLDKCACEHVKAHANVKLY